MKKQYTTINDVAAKAGVSKTTVSRYLNGHYERMSDSTREKISRVISSTGYRVNSQAKALTQHHSHLIGVVVADIENIFSSILFKGADQVLEVAGYSIMLMNSNNSLALERKQLERLINLRIDGLILQPVSQNTSDYDFLEDAGIQPIIVDRRLTPQKWPGVFTDNYTYSKMLSDYVARQGYQQVVVLTEDVHANSARQERYQGVIDSGKENGLTVQLVEVPAEVTSSKLYEKLALVNGCLTSHTVIYALKGTLLTRLMNTLIEYSIRVPEQVGIVAFDDWDWAKLMSPQITTIQQDPKLMGKTAAELLLDQLNGKVIPATTMIDSSFMVRHSLKSGK